MLVQLVTVVLITPPLASLAVAEDVANVSRENTIPLEQRLLLVAAVILITAL